MSKPKINQEWILKRIKDGINARKLEEAAGLTPVRLGDVKRGRATLSEEEIKGCEKFFCRFQF